jgi:flagellar export protein FliJ
MVREQKPGKFKYTLETVLKVRGIKERREKEKFADKQREYLTEKEKEEQLEEEKKEKEGELKHIIKKGPISQFEKVMRRHAHLGVLKKDIDDQIEKVIDASKRLEDQRSKLIESMKDRKIIEKDKGHKLEDYDDMMKNLEIKFLDEIATQRFKRGL